jgi:hypothetical protein
MAKPQRPGGRQRAVRSTARGALTAALAMALAAPAALAADAEGDAPSGTEAMSGTVAPSLSEGAEGDVDTTPQHSDFPGPHAAIEFGLGVLVLPDADVCTSTCDRGDFSVEVDAWPLFRASRYFAVGAGLTLALIPVQNPPQRSTELPRESSRRYFMAEGIGRYYFAYASSFEAWCGLSGGLVVVSDNFVTDSEESEIALISSKGANIATEGLTLGLATGMAFSMSKSLKLGGVLRVANWFLPSEPEQIAFGDRASLAGRMTMINLALSLSYTARP